MLRTLSLRNAKRQANQYLLYFISMIGAVALMYGFNALIFSDVAKELAEVMSQTGDNELGTMIVLFSIIIVFILGWFVGYMMNFMLRKRSQELSTYMILGIDKKQITKMFWMENGIIGLAAFVVGCVLGTLIANLLEAIIINMFGSHYSLSLVFSLQAVGLTLLYFCLIYLVGLFSSRRKLKKMQLIELLHYENRNEKMLIRNAFVGVIIFCVALLCGVAGIWLFTLPSGHISDLFLGLLLAVFCQLGLFMGLPSFLHKVLGNNEHWKFRNTHLFLYRLLTSKICNASIALGSIAVLLTLSIACVGIGTSFYQATSKLASLQAFDISILHKGVNDNFSQYSGYVSKTAPIESSYTYSIYTGTSKTFMNIRDKALSDYFSKVGKSGSPESYLMSENRYDAYMKYSDYCALRKMLGLEKVNMNANQFLVHCMPYLKSSYKNYVSDGSTLAVAGKSLSCAGVYTDTFSQYGGYGNGQEFILVVPDNVVTSFKVAYSLYVANMKGGLAKGYLNSLKYRFPSLQVLSAGIAKSGSDGYMTKLLDDDKDYIGGKYTMQSTNQSIVLILPLFYLALIVCIIGMVILAVQLLSEKDKNIFHYGMMKTLGMENSALLHTLRKHVLLYFSLPVVPAALLGCGLVVSIAQTLFTASFDVPGISSIHALTFSTVSITIVFFLAVYCIYGLVTYITMKRDTLNMI